MMGDHAGQALVLLMLGRHCWKSDETTHADRHVAEAIALLETPAPGRDLAAAYSARSQLAMLGKRVAEALEFGQHALDLAVASGDHAVQAHALNNIGTTLLCSGGQGGIEKLEQSL